MVAHSLKRDSILRDADASLTRLGVDAIDLYQIHWPIPVTDIKEGWAALAELKEQGLVRHIGVSNFDVEQLRQIQQIASVETLQPQYLLIEREIEQEILPFVREQRIGVIAYSPMGSGMLSGPMTRERAANLPETTGANTTSGSTSRNCRATSSSLTGSGRSPTDTTPSRAPSRSPGHSTTRPSPARSSASAAQTRSTRSSPPRTSTSPTRTSSQSKGAHDEH
jgi:aryl-alcohol dehydrogenase-like predicted oxidoreductase